MRGPHVYAAAIELPHPGQKHAPRGSSNEQLRHTRALSPSGEPTASTPRRVAATFSGIARPCAKRFSKPSSASDTGPSTVAR
jgi:hypothetical protein